MVRLQKEFRVVDVVPKFVRWPTAEFGFVKNDNMAKVTSPGARNYQ
jgi:hypothetical protein